MKPGDLYEWVRLNDEPLPKEARRLWPSSQLAWISISNPFIVIGVEKRGFSFMSTDGIFAVKNGDRFVKTTDTYHPWSVVKPKLIFNCRE